MSQTPLFSVDPEPRAIIEPAERFAPESVPTRVLLSFFGTALQGLVARERAPERLRLAVCGLDTPVFELHRQGERLAVLQLAVGAPVAAAQLEELIARGGRSFLACGGAGVLDSTVAQGHLIVPHEALREEGTSYQYLPANLPAKPGSAALDALQAVLRGRRVPFIEGRTWTTDALFRETPAKVAARKAAGCVSVEMEAAALFSVAQYRGVQLAQLLYGGDDVGGRHWDQRGWDQNLTVQEQMQELCLEALLSF